MTHIDYHAVLETLREHREVCPLCAFTRAAETQYFNSMLYSWVGTEGFQDRFLANDGFCTTHAHRLGSRNDGVAIAMLYAPLLAHRRRWLHRVSRSRIMQLLRRATLRRDRAPAARGERADPRACPLCDQIARWEIQFLRNLARHGNDTDLRTVYSEGSGLCLPHYRLLVHRVRRVPAWLEEHQEARMDALAEALDAYTRGASGGTGGRDSTVWRELLEFMEGTPGAVRCAEPHGRLRG